MDKLALIKSTNGFSWLNTNDESVSEILWKSLRFRAKNYYHNRRYKMKLWDGYDEFYKKQTGRFLTGLLPEVKAALQHLNVNYKVVNNRSKADFLYSSIDDTLFRQYGIKLEDYQVDLINQVIKDRGESLSHRGIIFAPTSAGKTLCMMGILKCLNPNTPTLILANKKQLIEQNYQSMLEYGITNAGRLYDKANDPNIFTCATFQSVHKMEKFLSQIKVIIVDEIHENMHKTAKWLYNRIPNCGVRIAVSATPFKFGGKDTTQKYSVKGYFGPIFKIQSKAAENGILTIKKLQELGRLSKAKCKFYPIDKPEIPYDVYLDAVDRGIAQNVYFNDIVKKLATSLKGRTLILVERVSHGDLLKNMMPDALWVYGKDTIETRCEVIKQLQESKDNMVAIVTQGIFNTGINVFVHNLINAAGGQADHVILQRFGRGLRVAGDKEILDYYDFIFKINPYLLDHSKSRYNILKNEGHDVKMESLPQELR